jgi:hypothetical protein
MGLKLPEKGGAIALDGQLGVAIREAEIECSPAVHARVAAKTGGKSVDQPGNFLQMAGLKDSQFGFRGGPGRHTAILAEKKEDGSKPPSLNFRVKGS